MSANDRIWLGDEDGVTTLVDSSGNGKDLELAGGFSWETDYGIILDGIDGHAGAADSTPALTGEFTIRFWIKTTANTGAVFSQINGGSGYLGVEIGVSQGGGGQNGKPSVYTDGTGWTSATTSVNDDAWHAVQFSRAAGNAGVWRVDAVAAENVTQAAASDSPDETSVGYRKDTSPNQYLAAHLTKIEVYDSVKDAANFAAYVAAGPSTAGGGTPPTIHYAGSPFSWTEGTAAGNNDPTLDSGDAATSYAVTSGALPTGVSLNASTGRISGTPSVMGHFEWGVTASNAGGDGPETDCEADVAAPAAPTIAYAATAEIIIGAAFSLSPSSLTGYGAVVTASRALPAGITLNATTGELSGTATDAAFAGWGGTHDLILTATNDGGAASDTVEVAVVYKFGVKGENGDGDDTTVETLTFLASSSGDGGTIRKSKMTSSRMRPSRMKTSRFR